MTQSKNPEEHYTYIDTRLLYWDQLSCFWRPRGTIGDRFVFYVNFESTELFNKNIQSFEVVFCYCDPRLRVTEKYLDL